MLTILIRFLVVSQQVLAGVCLFYFMVSQSVAGQTSSSLQAMPDGASFYSANFWQGSITRYQLNDEQQLLGSNELKLGEDIRRIAIDSVSNTLLATDYLANQLILVDLASWKKTQTIAVAKRPYAVVYQPLHKRFWVSLYESQQLIGVEDGRVVLTMDTAETPRGLALTEDDRLLVTHALTGQLSIYDVKPLQPKLIKILSLQVEQLDDETKSQGLPRLLDDIAISPDGQEAWLPHVLWNFDHEFQFQSTVFPAVSIIDLTSGNEQELVAQRKQLFKTINITDNKNRTRIVSNPQDAEFSASGAKVYVSLAGSDDIMVFDRSRSLQNDLIGDKKIKENRHRRKKHQGGAKAVQIFRHTPGRNPRGLLVSGEQLWVQNAIDQTLSLFNRGGDHAFDRVSLEEAVWATSSKIIDDSVQRGRALFHSARTDANTEYPIAGDFWMSCNSCHLDGFNFGNRFLVESHFQDKTVDARSGHPGLKHMVSGDHSSDFIRIIQKTQGGLGEDNRDAALPVDAAAPPKQVQSAMEDLKAMVSLPHNLPYSSSWLRLDNQTYTHPEDWLNSARCAGCHQEMFDQWADSNHRLMGESNPYFKVLLNIAGETEGEEFKSWCLGCHMPNNVMSNKPSLINKGHMFERKGASLYQALEQQQAEMDEGTGCLFCHRITDIEDAGGNAAYTVNLKDRERYVGEDQLSMPLMQWFADRQINARPEIHKQSYLQPFYSDPLLCKSCHNEFAPGSGALIVDTYSEWEASSFNSPDNPKTNRTCIDCHMHGDISKIGENIPGRSTLRGPIKENVITHQFTGANHHLVGLRNKEQEAMSLALLRSSATIEQQLSADGHLTVRVTNKGAGHALPTGVADFRQFWLQVAVLDAEGRQIFSSGAVDTKGAVDSQARMFMKKFGDEKGEPVGLLFWRYAKLLSDTRIPADSYRDEVFILPESSRYPLTIKTKLLYRIYPQWVTDAVRESEPALPNPPVIELQKIENVFTAMGG